MPYIQKTDREEIDILLQPVIEETQNDFKKLKAHLIDIFGVPNSCSYSSLTQNIVYNSALRVFLSEKYNYGYYNYSLSRLISAYTNANLSYHTIDRVVNLLEHLKTYCYNDLIGTIECAKLEFYRRIATPYEDKKIKENSDTLEYLNFRSIMDESV